MGFKRLLILGGFVLFPASLPEAKQTYGNLEGVIYLGNYDGDTVCFDIPGVHPLLGRNIPVRLRGADTPEIRGRCLREKRMAKAAKRMVQQILERAERITLRETGRGKYFRIVANINADDLDVKTVLLRAGLAVRYEGGRKTWNWCNAPLKEPWPFLFPV